MKLVSRNKFLRSITDVLDSTKDDSAAIENRTMSVSFTDRGNFGIRIKRVGGILTGDGCYTTYNIDLEFRGTIIPTTYKSFIRSTIMNIAEHLYDEIYKYRNYLIPVIELGAETENRLLDINIYIVNGQDTSIVADSYRTSASELLPQIAELYVLLNINMPDLEDVFKYPQLDNKYINLVNKDAGLLSEICKILNHRSNITKLVCDHSKYLPEVAKIAGIEKIKYENKQYLMYNEISRDGSPILTITSKDGKHFILPTYSLFRKLLAKYSV